MRASCGGSLIASQDGRAEELLGDLDGPVAAVDRSGTVAPIGAGWRVGWAVGADGRWHVAAEEAAVRPRLIDEMPVTATAMKVRGGDVTLRASARRDAAGRGVMLEFLNDTPVPVSLALGVTGSINAALVQGSCLLVDRRVAVRLGHAPGGAAAVADGDVWRAVRAEPPAGDCAARSRAGLAAAAVVVPLAPRVPLRATVGYEGEPADGGSPEEVAAGWRAVVMRAASVELPDDTAARAWRRGIATSILAAGGAELGEAARAAVVLDRVGLPDEADRARAALAGAAERLPLPPMAAAAAVRALASRRLRAGRISGLSELAGPLAEAAGDCLDSSTLEQAAAALETEAPAAARDARRLLAKTTVPDSKLRPAAAADSLAAVRDGVAFGGDGLVGIEALLDCLVAEAADRLVIAPALPESWKRSPVDVRSLATRHGWLSFSVRWHGSRPAVLWELVPRGSGGNHGPDGVDLRCGLDPSWSTVQPAGEALLSA